MYLMKRIVLLTIMSLFSLSLIAENRWYLTPGYMGNVELGVGSTTSRELNTTVLTSHGFTNGKGWYFGVGTGLSYSDCVTIPVFADVKYSIYDKIVSPFVSLKFGTDITAESAGVYCSPSVGMDYRNVSILLKYDMATGKDWSDPFGGEEFLVDKHAFSVGLALWF